MVNLTATVLPRTPIDSVRLGRNALLSGERAAACRADRPRRTRVQLYRVPPLRGHSLHTSRQWRLDDRARGGLRATAVIRRLTTSSWFLAPRCHFRRDVRPAMSLVQSSRRWSCGRRQASFVDKLTTDLIALQPQLLCFIQQRTTLFAASANPFQHGAVSALKETLKTWFVPRTPVAETPRSPFSWRGSER